MTITLNNHIEEFASVEQLTVSELLLLKNFTGKILIIKVNDKLVKSHERQHTIIKQNDIVIIANLVTGG